MNTKKQLNLLSAGPLFDYAALPRDVEVEARSAAAEIKTLMRRTAEDIIRVGSLLNAMKAKLGHGNFLPWLSAEFGMTDRTARRFMSVAEAYHLKSDTVSDLKPKALYDLASAEPDVRAEIERRIAAGEIVSTKSVRKLKSAFEALDADRERLEEARDLYARARSEAERSLLAGRDPVAPVARSPRPACTRWLRATGRRSSAFCPPANREDAERHPAPKAYQLADPYSGLATIELQSSHFNTCKAGLSCGRFDGHQLKLIPPCARTQLD